MQKINLQAISQEEMVSPRSKYRVLRRHISQHLRAQDEDDREPPYEIEHVILSSGKKNFPYHVHASCWELYYVLSGIGKIRTDTGISNIGVGDSIMCPPGEAHQIINDSDLDLSYLVIANNTPFDQCYYPDSDKMWFAEVLAPEGERGLTFVRKGFTADYWEGEE